MARHTIICTGAVLACCGLLVGESGAQHALGDGSALDANQRVGSGGRNVRANTYMQDMALRNAIVTGQASGGKSFRGSVGYESAGDFRGALGSDDIYEFQRDSFYSGLATSNVRGLAALQYSLGQTVAGQSMDLYGQSLIVRRPGGGSTSGGLEDDPASGYVPTFDAFARTRGALRSTADFLSATYDAPSMLSMGRDNTGVERAQVASALSGVKWVRQDNGLLSIGDQYQQTDAPEDGGDTGEPSAHEELMDRLRIRAERIDLDKILPALGPAGQVDGGVDLVDSAEEQLEQRRREALDRLLDAVRIEFEMPPEGTEDAEPDDSESALDAAGMREATRRHLIQELTGLVVQDRPTVTRLITGDANKDLYTLHMTKGQEALAEGRWFDAEERFGHALRQRLGDSMAAAGRVHAQLGAGMILSGGQNLRKLFTAYPELVTVRYAPALLPTEDAHEAVRAQLGDRIERRTAVAREAALLLAYFGYQTNDGVSIGIGLDAIDLIREEQQLGPDPMIDLLRAAWMPGLE